MATLGFEQVLDHHEGATTCGVALVDTAPHLLALIAWSQQANMRLYAMTPIAEFESATDWDRARLAAEVKHVFEHATDVRIVTLDLVSNRILRTTPSTGAEAKARIELDVRVAQQRWT